jgi:cation diffusion facilitator CzcD-associated flavoprotein CzcO
MPPAATDIVIVGAGFAGLCMAIRLKRAGIENFTILERAEEIGGTWRDNHYPGAACDVESHLYSFSFEPNPRWTRHFAPQREILDYLLHCTEKFGLRPHIRFRTVVERARLHEPSGSWVLEMNRGEVLRARALISACGGLSRPAYPNLRGLGAFEGAVFHSSCWDNTLPLEGKNVAVIGTGASAIQIVPSIAPEVSRLYIHQRTPPWIVPKPDRAIGRLERMFLRRVPFLQRIRRLAIYWQREALAVGFVARPGLLKWAERFVRRHLARSIADPALRAKLLPSYRMGCKRILPTNDYYPALERENVEVVTERIHEVRPHSIVTEDGRERPVDVIVLATGFQAAEQVAPFELFGQDSRRLDETWRDGAEAYLGTTVSGFPNLFFLVGPNTGLGHSSMLLMIESQAQYVLSCVQAMRGRGLKLLNVRADAQARYNERLRARLRKTVWASGCSSWYQTPSGKITTLWPGFTFEFRLRTRRFDARDYDLVRDLDASAVSNSNAAVSDRRS